MIKSTSSILIKRHLKNYIYLLSQSLVYSHLMQYKIKSNKNFKALNSNLTKQIKKEKNFFIFLTPIIFSKLMWHATSGKESKISSLSDFSLFGPNEVHGIIQIQLIKIINTEIH
ncbi:hypothetical protein BpHYR1_034318 [Brachionus plicatilis]|uniref:Uncharacterized protein n=1 Tax=Brachionus plicatilis TaxID=10195 RepID=A0A3M7RVK6_BRAPC|nr:hypothetical protein BpHYR1_034318 [Brachionus plicatilis]